MPINPDWEALSQLDFLLMRRVLDPLNGAIFSISLTDVEATREHPPGFWKRRAHQQVLSVINMAKAWQLLIRYKLGEPLPKDHFEPFRLQDLLNWLAEQLQLVAPLQAESNPLLDANRETIQEALLMLYSAAYTLGPNVHLLTQSTTSGVWFRVRYAKHGESPCPTDLEALQNKLAGSWRSEDAAFELQTAADFIRMNNTELTLQGSEEFCGFAFFLNVAGKRRAYDEDGSIDAMPELPVEKIEAYLNPVTTQIDTGQTVPVLADDSVTPVVVKSPGKVVPDSTPNGTPKTNEAAVETAAPAIDETTDAGAAAQEAEDTVLRRSDTTLPPDIAPPEPEAEHPASEPTAEPSEALNPQAEEPSPDLPQETRGNQQQSSLDSLLGQKPPEPAEETGDLEKPAESERTPSPSTLR